MAMFQDDSFRAPDYERFEHPVPAWYRDAKLGIFVHWGAYSVPAWAEPLGEFGSKEDPDSFAHNPYAEWYANTIRIAGSPAARHHEETYGDLPYEEFLDMWRAENFDADELMQLVAATGARYFVPTTKHHDGITLWDAPNARGISATERGPRRDLISEMAAATRRAGIRFGMYYSGGLDWHFNDLPPLTLKPGNSGRELAGRPNGDAYARYAHDQLIDLIDKFAPDVLWGDIDWPDAGKPSGPHSLVDVFDRFYDRSPEGVVNDRWGDTHWDFRTSEYQQAPALAETVWENTRGIGYSFGYNQLEDARHTPTGEAAVKHFVDVVSQGGNLLLNIGLMADGTIPALQKETLVGLAAWNARYGSLVFGSQPVPVTVARPSEDPRVRWLGTDDTVSAIVSVSGDVLLDIDPSIVDLGTATTADGVVIEASPEKGKVHVRLPERSDRYPQSVSFRLR